MLESMATVARRIEALDVAYQVVCEYSSHGDLVGLAGLVWQERDRPNTLRVRVMRPIVLERYDRDPEFRARFANGPLPGWLLECIIE